MRKVKSTLEYIFLIIVSIISLFPFIWMIICTTNKSVDITKGTFRIGGNLLNNIQSVFGSNIGFSTALWNSAKIAVISTLVTITICSMAGYGFEIYRSKKRDLVFNILLLSMMVPFAAIMVPLFRMFSKFNFIKLDTMLAVMVPSFASAFFIFFFRQNTKSYSKEIIEAGRIDGLHEFGIFVRIYVPTMKSTFAAAAIIAFMNSWNNYMWPLIALQSPEKRTVPLLISTIGSSYTPDYGMMMTAVVIATIPTALIFFLMQKQFVAGMTGSVKG